MRRSPASAIARSASRLCLLDEHGNNIEFEGVRHTRVAAFDLLARIDQAERRKTLFRRSALVRMDQHAAAAVRDGQGNRDAAAGIPRPTRVARRADRGYRANQ